MNRIIIAIGVLFCTLNSYSQNLFPVVDGNIEIGESMNIDKSKNSIFSNIKEWISKYHSHLDYKLMIQIDDFQNGKLIFKGNKSYNDEIKDGGKRIWINVKYTVQIDVKEYKYRIIVRDIKASITSFEFSLFSQPFNDISDISPLEHLNNINIYRNNIKEIKNKNKKIKNKTIKTIDHYNNKINLEQQLYNAEYDIIYRMIENLKDHISIHDDF